MVTKFATDNKNVKRRNKRVTHIKSNMENEFEKDIYNWKKK